MLDDPPIALAQHLQLGGFVGPPCGAGAPDGVPAAAQLRPHARPALASARPASVAVHGKDVRPPLRRLRLGRGRRGGGATHASHEVGGERARGRVVEDEGGLQPQAGQLAHARCELRRGEAVDARLHEGCGRQDVLRLGAGQPPHHREQLLLDVRQLGRRGQPPHLARKRARHEVLRGTAADQLCRVDQLCHEPRRDSAVRVAAQAAAAQDREQGRGGGGELRPEARGKLVAADHEGRVRVPRRPAPLQFDGAHAGAADKGELQGERDKPSRCAASRRRVERSVGAGVVGLAGVAEQRG
mmetsp:Transcript_40569/g.130817  ORF Transcript_40569/g.130817 Transcript_40569/m.130817 type:complete len:299 (+) Transcript_40569:1309-2205(+)